MHGTRWTKVEVRIVECFRAWDEPLMAARPSYEIVADLVTAAGGIDRVTTHQKLDTVTRRWRPPDPGDVVKAKWDAAQRRLRLDLGGDPRYDERLIRWLGRTRHPPPPGAIGT